MFIPMFIAILLGLVNPLDGSFNSSDNNTIVTTQGEPGDDGTGEPGGPVSGENGPIKPPKKQL
ncbi:MAG: hypothetical protein EOO85_30370 [Pedobacter sp.]|nr:MAG: hypothetical protein EOO85_30370 [Pedobacter sp.]